MGPPNEESLSWVAERDDNHKEEKKKQISKLCRRVKKSICNNIVFIFGMY